MASLSIQGHGIRVKNKQLDCSSDRALILQNFKRINNSYFFRPDVTLVNRLKTISASDLTYTLNEFFLDIIQEGDALLYTDPPKCLERLAAVIPCEKMEAAVSALHGREIDALQYAKRMLKDAEANLRDSERKVTIRVRLLSVLNALVALIEGLIAAFGIADFFKPPESSLHADFKAQKIMMLLTLFGTISSMLIPLLGAATAASIIGGTLLGIAFLSVVWPWIKPRTTYLPGNAENWTHQIQHGGFVAQGRKTALDKMACTLERNRYPILVGPSRVGKSLVAKAFADAIERGDYPELRGKVVFRINTAEIVGQTASFLGGGTTILTSISQVMGRHRKDIILVLDEIHMACKNQEKIADQLKIFLDEDGDPEVIFPYVIGITTEEEYKHVAENNAFSLRFDRVDIRDTGEDETMSILSNTILRHRAMPLIEDGTLEHLYRKLYDKNIPQPSAAIKLLKQCINLTGESQNSRNKEKMIAVSNKIASLREQSAAARSRKRGIWERIDALEKELSALQETVRREEVELRKLFKAKKLLDRTTLETYSLVRRVSSLAQERLTAKDEKQLKLVLLLHEFLGESLRSHIKAKSQELGVKLVIDNELVDVVHAANPL